MKDQKATTRCKACNSTFNPRINGLYEETMCGKCVRKSGQTTSDETTSFIEGYLMDKVSR